MEWSYFNKFKNISNKYLPDYGEGDSLASQVVTAVNKLIYKWYNDGDVYDNTYTLTGWANDLSSYANWLHKYTDADEILERIISCKTESEYEKLLADLADTLLDPIYLESISTEPKQGSIYNCDGMFVFSDEFEDDEDNYEYEEEEYYEDYDEDWDE